MWPTLGPVGPGSFTQPIGIDNPGPRTGSCPPSMSSNNASSSSLPAVADHDSGGQGQVGLVWAEDPLAWDLSAKIKTLLHLLLETLRSFKRNQAHHHPPGSFSGDGDESVGCPSGTPDPLGTSSPLSQSTSAHLAVSGPRHLAPLPIQKQVLVHERLLVALSPVGTTRGDEGSGEGRTAPRYALNHTLRQTPTTT